MTNKIKLNDYDVLQYISSGSSASYFLVNDQANKRMALSICQNNASNRERVKIQERLQGVDGVVQQLQWYVVGNIEKQGQNNSPLLRKIDQAITQHNSNLMIIIYEYYEGGVLENSLFLSHGTDKQRPQSVCSSRSELFYLDQNEKQQALQIFMNVLSIVQRIHEAGIYHFDLKPENIILSNMKAIIVDFGSAKYFSKSQRKRNNSHSKIKKIQSNMRGTLSDGYLILDPFIDLDVDLAYPTEVTQAFSSTRYDRLGESTQLIWCEKYDVYSLGCVLYHILTGQFLRSSLAKDSSKYLQIQTYYGPDLANLISLMTYRDPLVRLSIDESLKLSLEILKQRIVTYMDSSLVSCSGTDEVVHTNSHSSDENTQSEQPRSKRQILGQSPNDRSNQNLHYKYDENVDIPIQPPLSYPPKEQRSPVMSNCNIKKYLFEVILSRRKLAFQNLKRRMKKIIRAQSQNTYNVFTGKTACIYDDMQYFREENAILHEKIQPPRRVPMLYYNNLFKDLQRDAIIEFTNKSRGSISKTMIDFCYHIKYLIRTIQLETIKQLYTIDIQPVEEVNISQFEFMSDFSDSSSKVEIDVDESKLSQTSILYTTRSMTMEMMTTSGFLNVKSRSNSVTNLQRFATNDRGTKNTLSIIEASIDTSIIDDKQQSDKNKQNLEPETDLLALFEDTQAGAIYELSLLDNDDVTSDGY